MIYCKNAYVGCPHPTDCHKANRCIKNPSAEQTPNGVQMSGVAAVTAGSLLAARIVDAIYWHTQTREEGDWVLKGCMDFRAVQDAYDIQDLEKTNLRKGDGRDAALRYAQVEWVQQILAANKSI